MLLGQRPWGGSGQSSWVTGPSSCNRMGEVFLSPPLPILAQKLSLLSFPRGSRKQTAPSSESANHTKASVLLKGQCWVTAQSGPVAPRRHSPGSSLVSYSKDFSRCVYSTRTSSVSPAHLVLPYELWGPFGNAVSRGERNAQERGLRAVPG